MQEQEIEICEKWINGTKMPELAKEYSCSIKLIQTIRIRHGYDKAKKAKEKAISRLQDQTIITRQDAIKNGDTLYFDGRVCGKGHIDFKETKTRKCVICSRMRWYEYNAEKSPLENRLRPGFSPKCANCGKEVVLGGTPVGFEGSLMCRVAASYETVLCGSPLCSNQRQWKLNKKKISAKRKLKRKNDPIFRAKVRAYY